MMESNLTIIIPFLNEGEEVYNTVKSIRDTSNGNTKIILINDASTDNYDYKSVAVEFDTQYIFHSERKGVAASRDEGVNLCETDYFLLLDAHMRFYSNTWANEIVSELKINTRALLCCQSLALGLKDGVITGGDSEPIAYGARINFIEKGGDVILAKWQTDEKDPNSTTESIPCVLGAAYATSKKYWEYLKGLTGLRRYGCDEAYISMKVWLEGGECRLLKNIVVGHIYRHVFPYEVMSFDIIYNKMLIAELILPYNLRCQIMKHLKTTTGVIYNKAYALLLEESDQIGALKSYYSKIFTQKFDIIEMLNRSSDISIDEQLLEDIFHKILLNVDIIQNLGLLNGRMGIIIFLYHYARYSNNIEVNEIAVELLEELFDELDEGLAINIGNGLCGIGWGIEYLIQNDFIEGEANEILEDIDKKIMERNLSRINDLSFATGLGGILTYILCRLKSPNNSFYLGQNYFADLNNVVDSILENEEKAGECMEVGLKIKAFLNGNTNITISQPNIYDILDDFNFENSIFENHLLGLNGGLAGIALNQILK